MAHIVEQESEVDIYLDENNIYPEEYNDDKHPSKRFLPMITIDDSTLSNNSL
ncbi:hypothetical protein K4L44_13795 [Halosquirtibacter laminarini]|uniref:Uncharacterized protein n=1 Tax=Halosquirtibacter laminarini TaxID=3374600 RepID=A0AC61NQY2_9BACT|nr:hypothetical protein K4L44_13795 [Prolixibacteraceae bacterium]